MITGSIDVTRIDKSRLKKVTRKNGEKAVFFDFVLLDQKSAYGDDYVVRQAKEKDENIDLPILGNAKILRPRQVKSVDADNADEVPW